jgi:methylated-DNA-[protein]-cysteine S-methyltransferase
MNLHLHAIESPLGRLLLVAGSGRLHALDFADCRRRMFSLLEARYGPLRLHATSDPCGFSSRVTAYLDGDLDALDAIPLELGGTPFQRQVWSALGTIPPGETLGYGALAAALGRRGAGRAVGMASARNPVALVIPCHRLVRSDGSLGGYAGGIHRKRWLLQHEASMRPAERNEQYAEPRRTLGESSSPARRSPRGSSAPW